MKRRTCFKAVLAGAAGFASATAAGKAQRIQLHVDLSVDPAKEKEMLHNFHTIFKPAAAKQPGYVDVEMLKLNSALAGSGPSGVNYRFALTFESEDLRKKWIATDIHQKVWPTIEKTLTTTSYTVLLFDID